MAAEIRMRERLSALEILLFSIEQTGLFTEGSEELDRCVLQL